MSRWYPEQLTARDCRLKQDGDRGPAPPVNQLILDFLADEQVTKLFALDHA